MDCVSLKDLGSGETLLYLRLADIQQGETSRGDPYLSLLLADMSGSLEAKIWHDASFFKELQEMARGTTVKVLGRQVKFRGTDQLEISKLRGLLPEDDGSWDPEQVFGAGYLQVKDLISETLVMDIETAPLTDVRGLPKTLVQEVTRVAKDREWDIDKVLGLNPLFSRVVSIAVGDAEDEGGRALVAPPAEDLDKLRQTAPDWLEALPETEMLAAFWTLAGFAKTVVSYNGRMFDIPFLRTRSAVLGIPATCDLVSQPPYRHQPHLDLYLILTGGARGAAPMNLDAACYAFKIDSPKDKMDGSMVATAFRDRRYEDIARYNLSDVDATRRLYWKLKSTVMDFLG